MADALGIGQSEMIREALRRHLNALAAQRDASAYEANPLSPEELSLIGWPTRITLLQGGPPGYAQASNRTRGSLWVACGGGRRG